MTVILLAGLKPKQQPSGLDFLQFLSSFETDFSWIKTFLTQKEE
ncbi:MAG: hypothetical protein RJQ09_07420 [Cyclobacteriaceae bacterium]